jgi:membrane carboxypeptidase/penicillin-binding protein PbpC
LCFSAVTYHGQFNSACNKLKAESQKTKPQLANHDHQVLIQTEPDDNIKDSALKLALKHPAQTTESAWLIDNHGWADLRVSNALTLTPNSHDYQVIIQTESDDNAKDSSWLI